MNYQLTIVGCFTLLAFLAHMLGGVREALSVSPEKIANKNKLENYEALDRNWVQSMCAFQLVSVDLLVLSSLLFVLALTDWLVQKQLIAFGLSLIYFLWGCVWLIQLFALKRKPKDYLFLGHWVFWFLCSGLVYWGAQSL